MDEKNFSLPSVTGMQKQIVELQRLAMKDELSGLMNRDTLERRIKERLANMMPEETCALFIVDLDDFKRVNDTLGHQAGDQAIRQTGRVLSGMFRASDIVGRLGGDEFAVFLCGNITEKLVRTKAAAICSELQLVLGDRQTVNLTASVGVHLAAKGQAFEGLYRSADLALYKAKKAGKHRFYFKNRDSSPEESVGGFRPVSSIPLSSLLENLGSGVALLEMGNHPRVIYVSSSFCRLIGADHKTYPLPKPLSELIHPDDLVSLEETLRNGLARGEMVEHTHRISPAEGTGRWAWWHIRAVRIEYDSPDPVLLVTGMDISRFKETEQLQETQIRRLQAALDQTSKRLWEVDVPAGVFRIYTRDGSYRPLKENGTQFPDQLIECGLVHPGSVERFRTFAQELLEGRTQGFGNFAVRMVGADCYSWASVSYRMLFDDVGRAARAVGVMEELPQGFGESGMWPAERQHLPEGLVADLMMWMRANLDLDTVEALWEEGSDLTGQMRGTRCSYLLQMKRQKVFTKGDQRDLQIYFDREQLIQRFHAGQRWLCAEYRWADSGGGIRWVRHVIYLAEDPASRQIHLYAYLLWLDPGHRLEPAVRGDNSRNPVSRLYSRDTIRRIAEDLFVRRTGTNRAVVVLQLCGLARHVAADDADAERIQFETAAALSLVMGGSCVLGQYSPTRFVIVFPHITTKADLRCRIEQGLDCLRRTLAAEEAYPPLRFLAGASLMSAGAADYSTMLAQALRACALQADAVSDTVVFAQEVDDWGWIQLEAGQQTGEGAVRSEEMGRPLSVPEKDVAFDCVTTMLTSKTLDASVTGVLKTIGAYYHADRVYTLLLVEGRQSVIMTFEWTGPGKRSIQQVVSGMRLERFPLLERCLSEQAPVFLSRNNSSTEEGEIPEGSWCFTAFPLIREQEVEGFLCIENAREHPKDAALFSTLIPYLLLERERFHEETNAADVVRNLMGMPDRQAYLKKMQKLTSEHFSSLGAVRLDILSTAAAGKCSLEKDSKLLWYVAKTLTDLFGASLVFRIWDTEFVAFFPNTTREVFLKRCGRLRSILQRRYPRQVRIGRAWAEGIFTGRRLAEDARASMKFFSEDVADMVCRITENSTPAAQGDEQAEKRFVIYLQPKIDMSAGKLSGAEALVRGIGADGRIILPSQFISLLEEDGAIRNLDLMVVERSLVQMDQWRRAGLGIIPIAVNLSRTTIAHPSTLASILALQSRYPNIPSAALELEITERNEGVDNADLQQIVERYHACGLRLSLDDFGSQYANLPLFTDVRFDTVKLDRSLINGISANPISHTLVRDIVQICRKFHMDCIAEGVETAEQVAALLEMGCTCAQGFYYDKPLPMEEFEQKYLRGTAPVDQKTERKEEHP